MKWVAIALLGLCACEGAYEKEPLRQSVVVASVPFESVKQDVGLTGTYSTVFRAGRDARDSNIALAAKRLNGYMLPPGGVLSFNHVVGPRTEEKGFRDAPVLLAGVLVKGMGGGVCQVASTLHAAAVFARLRILERRPHSRWSSYIPPGLDATVAHPHECGGKKDCFPADLVVQNTYEKTLRVAANVIDEGKSKRLRISFYGRSVTAEFEYRHASVKVDDFEKQLRRSVIKSATYRKKHQSGRAGYLVRSTLVDSNGVVVDKWRSKYKPVAEIWFVGAEYDANKSKPWE